MPSSDLAQWRELALGVLRRSGLAGADTPPEAVEDLLSVTTYDGIRVHPLYTAQDPAPDQGRPGAPPFTRGTRTTTGWEVRQRHADPDPKATREAIVADLDNGVESIWLDLTAIDVGALPALLDELLDGVLDRAGIFVDAGPATAAAAQTLLALQPRRGNLGADPLGQLARTGVAGELDQLGTLARRCPPGVRAVTVDACVYHDAGGSDAQELAYAAATGLAYLRELAGAGLDPTAALAQLEFRYAATADVFATMAKLRAARRIWARVAEVCGAAGAGGQIQHAVTSTAMMTVRDPWSNLLRTTLACFGAAAGGAQAITVQPFDLCLGRPDPFARRIARNTQALLREEAHVGRVLDPAGGSWYVERLTEDLAQRAWTEFTEIERAGGLARALADGLIADRLADTWQRRREDIARRATPIIGVSDYPNLAEQLPARLPAAPPVTAGLPRHRYAEAFEALRARAERDPEQRPTVFLATIGPLSTYGERASFATNLFGAGGLATSTSGPSTSPGTDPAAIAAAFAASGTPLACLCGSDRGYADHAAPVAAALRAAGARTIFLVGQPADYPEIDGYLHRGCDATSVLSRALHDAGVVAE
jgi:methylmalonyl-CoA mutase